MWSSQGGNFIPAIFYFFSVFPIIVNNHERQKRQFIVSPGNNPNAGRGQLLIYSSEGNKSSVDPATVQALSNNVQTLTNLVMAQSMIVNELSRELSAVKSKAARKSLFAAKATNLVCTNKCIQVSKQVGSAKEEINEIRKEMRELRKQILKGAKSKDVDKLNTKVAVAMKNIDEIEEQVAGNSKIELAVKNIENTLKKVKKTIAKTVAAKRKHRKHGHKSHSGNANNGVPNGKNGGSTQGQNGGSTPGKIGGSTTGQTGGSSPGQASTGQAPPLPPPCSPGLPPTVSPRPTFPNVKAPARTTPLPEPPPTPGRPVGNCETPPMESWPAGHFCILANGPCPKEFNRHFGYMRSMALASGDRDHILPMHFGNSKIGCFGDYCGQYLNWVGEIFITACCK